MAGEGGLVQFLFALPTWCDEINTAVQEESIDSRTEVLFCEQVVEKDIEDIPTTHITYSEGSTEYLANIPYHEPETTTNSYYDVLQEDNEEGEKKIETAKYETTEVKGYQAAEKKMEQTRMQRFFGFSMQLDQQEEEMLNIFKVQHPGMWNLMYDVAGQITFSF